MLGPTSLQVTQNPPALDGQIGFDNLPKANRGIAANLLDGALIQRGNSFLRGPVARRRIGKDALLAVFVCEFDNELGFLVGDATVWQQLEAAGDEFQEVWGGGEVCWVGEVGGIRAPSDVAEERGLGFVFGGDGLRVGDFVFEVAVVVVAANLCGSGDEPGVLRLLGVENALDTLERGRGGERERKRGRKRERESGRKREGRESSIVAGLLLDFGGVEHCVVVVFWCRNGLLCLLLLGFSPFGDSSQLLLQSKLCSFLVAAKGSEKLDLRICVGVFLRRHLLARALLAGHAVGAGSGGGSVHLVVLFQRSLNAAKANLQPRTSWA